MSIFPPSRREWFRLLHFPFRAYLPLGAIFLLALRFLPESTPARVVSEAETYVFLGYLICTLAFLILAVIRFYTRQRELIAETLLLAGLSLLLGLVLACAF
jgi:hypothetical protein